MRKNSFIIFALAFLLQFCGQKAPVYLKPHPDSVIWKKVREKPEEALNYREQTVYDTEAKGFALLRLGRLKEAEEKFRKALQMGEESFSNLGLGMVYEKIGDFLTAYRFYSNSSHPEARGKMDKIKERALSQALSSSDPKDLSEALIIAPNSKEAYIKMAEFYLREGENFMATAYLKKGISAVGEDQEILRLYSEALEKEGKLNEALSLRERTYKLYPSEQNKREMETLRDKIEKKRIEEKLKPLMGKVEISRGDLALVIDAYFGPFLSGGKPPIITDIYRGEEMSSILKITSLGIMKVFPDHTFQPDGRVKRKDLAEIIVRLIRKLNVKVTNMSFPVLYDTNSYDAREIVGLGIMEGEANLFHPYESITLKDAIKSMEKLRELLKGVSN